MLRRVLQHAERVADAVELAGAGDAAAVLGADVDCDRVEQVLVVVVFRQAAHALEGDDVLEAGAFELRVGHRGEVEERGGTVCVGTAGAGVAARGIVAVG